MEEHRRVQCPSSRRERHDRDTSGVIYQTLRHGRQEAGYQDYINEKKAGHD